MNINESNVLGLGISTLEEMEEKIKAFQSINLNTSRRRYILSREDIYDSYGKLILRKAEEIDLSKAKLLGRHFKSNHVMKIFQPDEGITVMTNMNNKSAVQFSIDLLMQIVNIEQGAYEAFIDRVNSFKEMKELFSKALFPKLIIVGYLDEKNLDKEREYFNEIHRADPYIRFLEVKHTVFKAESVFSRMRQSTIVPKDKNSWKKFILDVIREYKKPYLIEER